MDSQEAGMDRGTLRSALADAIAYRQDAPNGPDTEAALHACQELADRLGSAYRAYSDTQADVLSALAHRALSESMEPAGLYEIFEPLSRDDVHALLWVVDMMRASIENEFESRPEE